MAAFRKAPGRGKSELNAAIAALARRQGGNVTRTQLLELGLGRRAIQSRVSLGQLIRLHQGVYAVGHLPTTPSDQGHGALLAAGERSALAGRSAAAVWELYRSWSRPLELISPLQRRIPGLIVRRSGSLLDRDVQIRDGLRVTSPARTLLDLAPNLDERTLHRFHNELRMRRLITNAQLIDVATRNPSHRGAKRLKKLAGASGGEAKRSPLEIDWTKFAKAHRLPGYEMNVKVASYTVDVLFSPRRLIVELDGWGTHGTRKAYEDDRERDAEILAKTGIPTVRITHDGLHKRPEAQAARLRAALAYRA